MVSKSAVMRPGRSACRLVVCAVLVFLLVASLVPGQAFAYFNRGSVTVDLGTTSIELQAGATSNVTVSFTPSSDAQTDGCGMPKCPQDCGESCLDENGQCTCGGSTEYKTYYPTAQATSSDSSVATATYKSGVLTVYGRGEGEADITVRASLRQFTDGTSTLHVKVSGTAAGYEVGSDEFVEVPEQAGTLPDDRADYIEKTVMGRPIHFVRINDACDAPARLAELAGIDGDTTFWEGDTYYHPNYSLTFLGTDYEEDDLSEPLDMNLTVSTQASGAMNQPLSGLDEFVVVDFQQRGALPAPATVYALADTALSDDAAVSLYSYDEAAKRFVREDAEVAMKGGYAKFAVQEGKTYVVSTHDLTTEANAAIAGPGGGETGMQSTPVLAGVVLGIAALVVIVAVVVVVRRRRASQRGADMQRASAGEEGGRADGPDEGGDLS